MDKENQQYEKTELIWKKYRTPRRHTCTVQEQKHSLFAEIEGSQGAKTINKITNIKKS